MSRKPHLIIEESIEIYKSEPRLWQVISKDYHDRNKKATVCAKLPEKLQELKPDATKETVQKKLMACEVTSGKRKSMKVTFYVVLWSTTF